MGQCLSAYRHYLTQKQAANIRDLETELQGLRTIYDRLRAQCAAAPSRALETEIMSLAQRIAAKSTELNQMVTDATDAIRASHVQDTRQLQQSSVPTVAPVDIDEATKYQDRMRRAAELTRSAMDSMLKTADPVTATGSRAGAVPAAPLRPDLLSAIPIYADDGDDDGGVPFADDADDEDDTRAALVRRPVPVPM